MKDDRIYLEHILECIEWISAFTEAGKENFFADHKTQSAVLRDLQTLAESAQRLSSKLKDAHPEVPWQSIGGFRNVLVHDYLGINVDRVWEVIENDLPVLRINVLRMHEELEKKI